MKKYCPQCKADVRKADYYRHPKTADGLMPICKSCHIAFRARYVMGQLRKKE